MSIFYYRNRHIYFMKIQELQNFNPEAELHISIHDHDCHIDNVSWEDNYDRDNSLESIKRSMNETSNVYLEVSSNVSETRDLIPFLDSDKCILTAKIIVKKIKNKNALVKQLNIKEGDWLVIDYELKNQTRYGRAKAQYVNIYNSISGMKKEHISMNILANMINKDFEIQRIV